MGKISEEENSRFSILIWVMVICAYMCQNGLSCTLKFVHFIVCSILLYVLQKIFKKINSITLNIKSNEGD